MSILQLHRRWTELLVALALAVLFVVIFQVTSAYAKDCGITCGNPSGCYEATSVGNCGGTSGCGGPSCGSCCHYRCGWENWYSCNYSG